MNEECPLCGSGRTNPFSQVSGRVWSICRHCDLRYVEKPFRPSPKEERERYALHRNDITDTRYQDFVRPLVQTVKDFRPLPATGLDYGCGPQPVAAHLLQNDGYTIRLYDPFYHPKPEALADIYDFAFACEVAEHFHNPKKDFQILKSLLRPGGSLYFMTLLWADQDSFSDWHYSRDPTHVAVYSRQTFDWIRTDLGFSSVDFRGERVVVLR